MKRKANLRVLFMFGIVLLVFALLSVNVFVVSVLGYHINSATNIKDQTDNIYVVEDDLIAKRGSILDRNGTPLAQDITAYTLHANIDPERFEADKTTPAHVVDKEAAAQTIADIIGLEYEKVLATLNTEDSKQVEFGTSGKYLSLSQKEALQAANIPGLGFTEIVKRDYYNKTLASTLIGRSVFDETNATQSGIMGVEKYYDEILTGTNGVEVYRQDTDKNRFQTFPELSKDSIDGKSIMLTIDRGIQEELENSLQQLLDSEKVGASEAWGAVMNIKTGEILGFADRPAFNADDPNTIYLNRGTQYEYEAGSTIKTLTIASAIDNGAITAEDTFDSSPFYLGLDANGNPIRVTSQDNYLAVTNNAEYENWGRISYYLGYQYSSNVGIADLLTNKLDPQDLMDDLELLGLFSKVNTDRIPDIPATKLWNTEYEKITNGFGQGSTATMLQILQAYSAIFGNGSTVKPYFVKQIINAQANTVDYEAMKQTVNEVFKESTVKTVRELMYDNVENVTLTRFKMDEVSIMAKSGTSQIVIDGAYSTSQHIYSAAIGFPYEDPEYAFYFAYQTGYHNTRDSAEIMKNVIRKVLATYPVNVNDGYIENGVTYSMKNVVNMLVSDAKSLLEENNVTPLVFGSGNTVINQYPKDRQSYISSDKVLLFTSTNDIVMPDMSGWSTKEVNAFSELSSIKIVVSGNGYVTEQSVAEGTLLDGVESINVSLE